MFTHVALDDYRVAKSGITGGVRTTAGSLVPYVVFIEPEFARVGLGETDAQKDGIAYRLAKLPLDGVPRARTLGERTGFVKALVAVEDDRILGFAMLGAQAGEVMAAVQMAMLGALPYTMLRDGILAHPTMAEGPGMLFAKLQPALESAVVDAVIATGWRRHSRPRGQRRCTARNAKTVPTRAAFTAIIPGYRMAEELKTR